MVSEVFELGRDGVPFGPSKPEAGDECNVHGRQPT
jgi:hypothetical protein